MCHFSHISWNTTREWENKKRHTKPNNYNSSIFFHIYRYYYVSMCSCWRLFQCCFFSFLLLFFFWLWVFLCVPASILLLFGPELACQHNGNEWKKKHQKRKTHRSHGWCCRVWDNIDTSFACHIYQKWALVCI